MAKDPRFNVRSYMQTVVWSEHWLSNGHFAVLKEAVKLGSHMTSRDAICCAFPKAENVQEFTDEKFAGILNVEAKRVEFRRSPWTYENATLFLDDGGNAAWFSADYCASLNITSLWGPVTGIASFFNAATFEEASVVIMPMKTSADWDTMARAIAASASFEESAAPEPTPMMDVPPAETESAQPSASSVVDHLMEGLANPTSGAMRDAVERLRPKPGSGIDSITISSPGHEPVTLTPH